MIELSIIHGCCTIELVRNISGNNFNRVFRVVGNVLVNERNFWRLSYDANRKEIHWLRKDDHKNQSYYAFRVKWRGGRLVHIHMAREILGLLPGIGHGGDKADHKNHDIRDNREENLRPATSTQSNGNIRKFGSRRRFKSVGINGSGYQPSISFKGSLACFPTVSIEAEAGQMYKYAATILHDTFACYTEIPLNEVPSRERRWELMGMVVEKLVQKRLI